MAAAPSQLSSEDQISQFREFLLSYNKLADLCFADCVHDFTARSLSDKEESCAMTCIEKYLKATQRISMRFQEHQMTVNESTIAQAQALQGETK